MKNNSKILPTVLLSLLLGACGGAPAGTSATNSGGAGTTTSGAAGGSSQPNTPAGPSTTVEQTLDRLGVDRNLGARVGTDNKPVPPSFSPLGTQIVYQKVDELFTMGTPLGANGVARTGNASFLQFDAPGSDLMASLPSEPPWAVTTAGVARAAAPGDVDGDGREETIVAWVNTTDPSHNQELNLSIVEDSLAPTPFSITTNVVDVQAGINSLAVATADFDGDGQVDVAIGIVTATAGKVLFLHNDKGTFTVDPTATKTLIPVIANATPSGTAMSLKLQPAQLDADAGSELVVLVNEPFKANGNDSGMAHYFVYDDASAAYAQLAAATVSGGPGLPNVVVADIAAGDIDGDGLDEIVLGGLVAFQNQCAGYDTLAVALDDAAHGFAQLGATTWTEYWHDCDDAAAFHIRWAPVRVLNIDGDDEKEMLIGNRIFDDWKTKPTFTEVRTVPQTAYLEQGNQGWLDQTTSAVATGDFDGDGVDDVMVFSQDLAGITLLVDPAPGAPSPMGSISSLKPKLTTPTLYVSSSTPETVVLLPVNVDNDSLSMRRSDQSHTLIFTQPLVIAALAAAPCEAGIGQNTDACVTTYGTTTTQSISKEQVLSVSAGISVGIHIDGGELTQSEATVKATVTTTASSTTGSSSSFSRSVTFTSGPLEDTVVFSTIPYDQYNYVILTSPDPKLVGAAVTVSLPRSPIVLMAERSFYNAAIPTDGLRIDEKVFRHTPGDITTYPAPADVQNLQTVNQTVVTNGPFTVGQGASSTEFQLDVGDDYSEGQKLAMDYEMEVEATVATVMGGFTVGAGTENSMTVTSGSSTTYSGTVGSIADADAFANNLYNYGIYTYVQVDAGTGQKFEVINFWVQR